ncbi:MAG: ABC transporter substrate-binding protein [Cellulosilyticum sp.]|nr:ABC transporter substrate-binding protein [Cellulosilyticum sp.]
MKMKKVGSLIGTGTLLLSLCVGCSSQKAFEEPMDIAALNGPTGMGMTKLIHDANKDYNISLYQSPDEITGKIISGELDVACVPSNLAPVLYNKTEKNILLLGVNTLGVLYIIENGENIHSIEDLKGQKLLASGKGSTPEYVLNQILTQAGIADEVEVQYYANHTEVINALLAGESTVALLPEPHVTIAKTKGESIRSAVDLNEAWESQMGTQLPMGVIIAHKEYVDRHASEVETFLKDYEASVKFVNESQEEAAKMMVEAGLFEKEPIALSAIPNAHIVFEEGKAAQDDLEGFYSVLESVNPKAIGGSMPDETFYYGK